MMIGRKVERLDPEEVEKKRQQIMEIIDRCGRLSDEDLAEVFGGEPFENVYSTSGSTTATAVV